MFSFSVFLFFYFSVFLFFCFSVFLSFVHLLTGSYNLPSTGRGDIKFNDVTNGNNTFASADLPISEYLVKKNVLCRAQVGFRLLALTMQLIPLIQIPFHLYFRSNSHAPNRMPSSLAGWLWWYVECCICI